MEGFLQCELLEFAFSSHFLILILQESLYCPIVSGQDVCFLLLFWVWWLFTCVLVMQLADQHGAGLGLVVVFPCFIHTGIKFTTQLHSMLSCLIISKWIRMNQRERIDVKKMGVHLENCTSPFSPRYLMVYGVATS